MGSWGYKALESDEGLEVVGFLERYVAGLPGQQVDLLLMDVITALRRDGMFGVTHDEVDFLYDNTAMALAELYVSYLDNGELSYSRSDPTRDLKTRVMSFTADAQSLQFLLRYLTDISDAVSNPGSEREIVELWVVGPPDHWVRHLRDLIARLADELRRQA